MIPYGYCHCGCGGKTTISKITSSERGVVAGEPVRWLNGHANRRPAEERFWEKVYKTDDCWLWVSTLNSLGYGNFWDGGRQAKAHRFAYELLVGPIPDGLVIDHLCQVRRCVNPAHLEPVTQAENCRRAGRARTACRRCGTTYTEETTYWKPTGSRECRICRRANTAAWKQRALLDLREKRKGAPGLRSAA